jgi:hypothetical protein
MNLEQILTSTLSVEGKVSAINNLFKKGEK